MSDKKKENKSKYESELKSLKARAKVSKASKETNLKKDSNEGLSGPTKYVDKSTTDLI